MANDIKNKEENIEDFKEFQSDLDSQNKNIKKFQGIFIFAVGGILFLILGFYSIRAFTSTISGETKEETPQESKDMAQSVKSKEFPAQENFNDYINQKQENAIPSSPIMMTANKPKPRIIKGAGLTMIASASSQNGSFDTKNSDLSLQEKPDTVLEFGQNGGGVLGNANNLQGESSDYVGEVFTPSVAKVSQFDQNLLLPKGTYIGCALKTKLVSSVKGGIACIVSNDVYSANGNTLLIEKGSTITGTFNTGQMDDGMDRLFVIWQEIRTPNNIIIPVNSGASDELGASGVQGWVDRHYLKRFGSAVLLSMIDDSLAILANQMSSSKGNNNYANYTENTRDSASEIANTALSKMIDIKPTLYKNQGDLVGVYVNRDIDFSKVYQLRLKK